jgi:hypothetical protein
LHLASVVCSLYPRRFLPYPPLTLMRKNTDVVSGLVREEHPFHQAQTQPGKAKQHRYERRKVRGILKVGDWGEEIEYEETS